MIIAACSAQDGLRSYECQSGGQFSVRYGDDGAEFDYRGETHTLPATGRPGVYSLGEMSLHRKDDDVSLRIRDEVVVWGCRDLG